MGDGEFVGAMLSQTAERLDKIEELRPKKIAQAKGVFAYYAYEWLGEQGSLTAGELDICPLYRISK